MIINHFAKSLFVIPIIYYFFLILFLEFILYEVLDSYKAVRFYNKFTINENERYKFLIKIQSFEDKDESVKIYYVIIVETITILLYLNKFVIKIENYRLFDRKKSDVRVKIDICGIIDPSSSSLLIFLLSYNII